MTQFISFELSNLRRGIERKERIPETGNYLQKRKTESLTMFLPKKNTQAIVIPAKDNLLAKFIVVLLFTAIFIVCL